MQHYMGCDVCHEQISISFQQTRLDSFVQIIEEMTALLVYIFQLKKKRRGKKPSWEQRFIFGAKLYSNLSHF